MSDSLPTATPLRAGAAAASTYLLVPIMLFFALLIVAVLRSESLVTSAGLGSAVIVVTPLVLATYALMALAIAGRGTVDLSIGPLIGFVNVTLIQLFDQQFLDSPVAFVLYALAVGVAYQLVMGLIIVFVRVQPIIVALSGYLALSGVNLVIMQRPGGVAPDWMQSWGLGISVFSPVTLILILATVAWLLFTRTAFYGHLRLMGSDERAAFTSGVRINVVRLGAHAIGGLFAGLAALTYTSLISSGDPTQGTTYTLIAVTALVLGGASLAGGRGGVIGSLLGAVNIYLITYVLATFNFGAVQSFVTDLAYGTILVLSLLLTVVLPHIRGVVRSVSPLLFFAVLSLIALGVIIHATYDYSKPGAEAGAGAGSSGITVLGAEPAAPASDSGSGITVLGSGSSAPAGDAGTGITVLGGPTEPAVPAAPAAPAAAPPPQPAPAFIFEAGSPAPDVEAPVPPSAPRLAGPLAIAGLLILSLLVILRTMVAQAGASRSLAPLVYVVVAAVVLLGVYAAADPSGVGLLGGPAARTEGRG
ncbi:Ribose/xylose/arabinose/galactoside ABC-type transport system, permease component [Tistlia consotensis]|uniref:Ribose/xylose/arabinose/galactoside ABC-type transport system, permease component n=1 Tax=Tistlia consotensis USBA 355 TaxID=560819 RepID=A0A1Y6BVG0_9PROT|nr:ABC transporter permease [Tistlia consotensis]SMF29373.1 Ribose/xylose/arabinose/galactoside ABC-type transport system, permease component [Tistlia consotensis USBA 355]SNR91347.1 Ribose/xylose/arabinose/galactoside ABC-type transport system, permease component [Tistlia consotensis]